MMTTTFKHIVQAVADTFFPRTCSVCGSILATDEKHLCKGCFDGIPRTHYENHTFNAMEQLFAGKTPIQRASGFYFYRKKSPYTNIIIDIKYHDLPLMGEWLAEIEAREAMKYRFFDTIDMIIPVPMHKSKLTVRGYNQAEYIAQGISKATGIPVAHNIIAVKPHDTQTHRGITERWLNAQGLYASHHPDELQGKHILIVDDVVTTGATLLSCAKAVEHIAGIKISLMSLAVAQLD